MNQREMEMHLVFQVSFIIFLIVTIIFTIIYLLTDNVNAKEQIINTNISARPYMPCGSSGGTNSYCVQDNNNTSIVRTKGNTYNGVLLDLTFQFQQQLNTNMASQFVIDIYAMSTDFRNNNFSALFYSSSTYDSIGSLGNYSYSFVSKNQVRLIVYPDNLTYHTVILSGSPLTGVNTYGIKKVTITYDDGQQDNSGIINNQNQNTQDIMDNNNSNTQDIIQSNVLNFTNLIEKNKDNFLASLNQERSQLVKMCTNAYDTPLKLGKTLSVSDGSLIDRENAYYTEDYINIDFLPGTKTRLYIDNPPNSVSGYILVAYDSNKQYLGRVNTATRSWAFPSGTQYFRFSSPVPNTLITANTKCVTSDDAINNYLQDDSNPTINDSAISNTLESVAIDDPLNYLLTLPTHTIQRINYHLGRDSCEPVNLGSFLDTDLTLPCYNIKGYLGNSLYNLIDILMAIGLGSVTLKKFYDSISNVLTLGKEKEVREKLELPTPMEFFAMIFGGGK